MEAPIITVYGNTLNATDYRRVCEEWQRSQHPVVVRFIFPPEEILFAQDDHIIESTAIVLPLPGEELGA